MTTLARTHACAAFTLVAALAATGCGTLTAMAGGPSRTPAAAAPAPASPPGLDGTAWMLASLAGRPVPAGAGATLRFEGDRVSGSDGCNRFAGPWSGRGATLSIGPNLAATRRACPEPQGTLAADFGRALVAAGGWRIDGTRLVLLGEGGTALATFEPQPTGLAGTAWQVHAYNTGRGAVTGVATAGRLSIGPLRTTRMVCSTPADVMEREAAFLRALESASTAQREADRLELRTAAGALAISATASPGR
jgi:heat shock protein HslJ